MSKKLEYQPKNNNLMLVYEKKGKESLLTWRYVIVWHTSTGNGETMYIEVYCVRGLVCHSRLSVASPVSE